MRTEPHSLEYVDAMIDFLEQKIEKNEVTHAMLGALQKRLDAIDASHRDHPHFAHYYPHMLELQTLIFGESNQEVKALHFLKEAVRQAGSVGKLYSKLLKLYIAKHTPQPALATVPVVAEEPTAINPDVELSEQYSGPVNHTQHASEMHIRPRFRALKVGFVAVFGLAVLSVSTLHFVPRAAALPMLFTKHAQIQGAKQAYDSLTEQYNACSSKLASEHGSVDTYDTQAVEAYNQETKDCQAVQQQQNQAAAKYDNLIDKS